MFSSEICLGFVTAQMVYNSYEMGWLYKEKEWYLWNELWAITDIWLSERGREAKRGDGKEMASDRREETGGRGAPEAKQKEYFNKERDNNVKCSYRSVR